MSHWTNKLEEELTLLLKEWLKAQGRTQSDLSKSLNSESSRMPAILDVLKREHRTGGMPHIVAKLCSIENDWSNGTTNSYQIKENTDPFGQLDLILQELKDKSEEKN